MHAVSPPVAQLGLDGPPGEVQPGLVEERALLVGTRHPDECRSHIHDLEHIHGDRHVANVRVPSHVTTSPQYRLSRDYRVSGVCATALCAAQTLPNNSVPKRSKQSTG